MSTRLYVHGTNARYSINACRCNRCRAAHATYIRRRHRAIGYGTWDGLVDATGITRRLQALARAGWTFTYIGQRRHVDPSAVRQIARAGHPKMQAAVARQYALLYDELCTADGGSKRSASEAARKGWPGPEAWTDQTIDDPDAKPYGHLTVDDVLVQRAIDGDPDALGQLTPAERVEATRRLLRRPGITVGSLPRLLKVSGQTAHRLAEQAEAAA